MHRSAADVGESQAYNVIRWVPGIGQAYGLVRAGVYALKGDESEAQRGLVNMVYGGEEIVEACCSIPDRLADNAIDVGQKIKDKVLRDAQKELEVNAGAIVLGLGAVAVAGAVVVGGACYVAKSWSDRRDVSSDSILLAGRRCHARAIVYAVLTIMLT